MLSYPFLLGGAESPSYRFLPGMELSKLLASGPPGWGSQGLSNKLMDPSNNPYLGLAVPILRTNDVQRSQEFLCQKHQMEVGAVGSNSSQGTINHDLLDHP